MTISKRFTNYKTDGISDDDKKTHRIEWVSKTGKMCKSKPMSEKLAEYLADMANKNFKQAFHTVCKIR